MAAEPERKRLVEQPTVQFEWDATVRASGGVNVQTCVDMAPGPCCVKPLADQLLLVEVDWH